MWLFLALPLTIQKTNYDGTRIVSACAARRPSCPLYGFSPLFLLFSKPNESISWNARGRGGSHPYSNLYIFHRMIVAPLERDHFSTIEKANPKKHGPFDIWQDTRR
jgi:hypothetical protein